MRKSKYFKLTETVCPHVHSRFGERAWMFFSDKYLDLLDFVKECFMDKPVIINNWNVNGQFSQRGLRCNICSLVKNKTLNGQVYVSAHMLAQGFDFSVSGITAKQARQVIADNIDKLGFSIRLEDDASAPTWVHVDFYQTDGNNKITYFRG